MYVLIAGGGKVGANVARTLLALGHEVTLIEQRRDRFERLEEEFEHQVQHGDATELFVLERAGIRAAAGPRGRASRATTRTTWSSARSPASSTASTKVIARVNDPRNQEHFDLLGIAPTVSATASVMALIEHEVPEHELVHLLELRKENLEIVEVQIDKDSPSAGKRVDAAAAAGRLAADLASCATADAEIAVGATELRAGDQVLAILEPGKEDELRRVLLKK